ncbi:MAG: hypothetical protein KDM63_08670, partial [Verrucomicrobiae bacterium]|nr:hypothetical protein [Verrucomicrobiae bacterium]
DISNHIAAEGGAFYVDSVTAQVIGTNVTLNTNVARTRGGAFRVGSTGATVQLTDSSINGNTANNEHGGGFYNVGTVILENTTVDNNQGLDLDAGIVNLNNNGATPSAGPVQRDSYGGGFYNSGGTVIMTGGSVSNNQTYGHGGGFYTSGGSVSMDGTVIDSNVIVRDSDLLNSGSHNRSGGGFYSGGDGTVTLADVQIINNVLPSDSDTNTRGVGGGFYNLDGSTVTITGASLLSGNRAEDGGAFYNTSTGGTVILTGSDGAPVQITNNTARVRGGGFRTTGDTEMFMQYVEITNNSADIQRGGGFYADGAFIVGSNVKINNNIAGSAGRSGDEQGGGFWLDTFGKVILTDSEIIGNFAEANGGGFYSQHGTVDLTGTLVSQNTTTNGGGGGFLEGDARLILTDSTISENIAREHGGGFYAVGDTDVTITRTHIDNNLAGYELDGVTRRVADYRGGGFRVHDRVRLTMIDSTLDGNIAAQYAAGGYVGGESTVTIQGSTIAENVSAHHGAGFFVESSGHLSLQNSTISGNYAGFRLDPTDGISLIYTNESVGGAIWNSGGATITELDHVTVTNNFATRTDGAGIHRSSGSIFIQNSIIYGNIGNAEGAPTGTTDIQNAATLIGNNIIGTRGGSALIGNLAGRVTSDPGLGALADNGGFGRTHAILDTSIAANKAVGSTVSTDQRGEGRLGGESSAQTNILNVLGKDLPTTAGVTMGTARTTTADGDSLDINAGTADNETIFDIAVAGSGDLNTDDLVTVTITLDYTRPSTDHDPAFILTDGTNSLTISMADNDGGSVSGNGTLLTGTIPTVAGSSTIVLTYSFTTGGNALGAMEGLLSKTLAGTTGLDAATGLTFRMRGGNGGEIYQIDGIAVSYSVASGSSDLGAYEVDPVATTLTLDEMIVPENLIGGQAFEVHSHATSTGAGPLVYSWEVTDEGGNLLTSGTGDTTNLTTSLTAENPVQNVTVTLTVTDTTTGQSVTQTQKTVLTQADATGATGTAGSVVVTTVDDVVESTTDRLSFDTGTTSFVVGETVTGGTSGATAEVVAILNVTGTSGGGDEAGTLVLRTLSGTFADDEAITSASGAALANGANFTDVDHLVSLREAINLANASGAGSFVITFDPSLDTTNIISSLNPNVISLNYDTETANFAVGETVTSSTGGSALIIAVIDNGASGTLSLINVTGTFNDNNALSVGGTQRALANGGLYNDDLNRGGDFDITKSNGTVYIVGNGMTNTIIDGGAVDRVFDIKARAEVVFEDLKITGGVTTTATLSDHGAGFRNTGGTV